MADPLLAGEQPGPLLEPAASKMSRLRRWGLGPLPSEHVRRPETLRHLAFLVVGISGSAVNWWGGTIFQTAILVLIVANVGLVIIDTEPYFDTSAGTPFNTFYTRFEIVSVVIFTSEYLVRLWCCVELPGHVSRLRWATTPLAIVDFVSLVPFYSDLLTPHDNHFRGATMLRTLRTFSLLRMERTFKGFRRIADVLQHKGEELFITAFIAMIMLILSSSIMYYIENPDGLGPGHGTQFTSISSAMWWSVAAFTTTGYGDMVPTTVTGKFLGGLLAILGVGFFALPAGILGSGFVEIMLQEKKARMERQSGTGATSHTVGIGGVQHEGRIRMPSPLARASTVSSLLLPSGDAHARDDGVGSHPTASVNHVAPPSPRRDGAGTEEAEAETLTLQHVLRALQQGQPALARTLVEERLSVLR